VSTVRKYLSKINLKCGLNDKFFELLKLKFMERNKYERHGILIFDEMQVRESISLNVKNMKLSGIQDFGENNVATAKPQISEPTMLWYLCLWYLYSLSSPFCQPVAVYAARGATKGTCLAQLMLEIIKKLKSVVVL
jgi:hypothetical protein